MSNPFFDHPILNSPYEYPRRHWELDELGQPTQKIIEQRRSAKFVTPIPKPKKHKPSAQKEIVFDEGKGLSSAKQQYDTTSTINEVRNCVDTWRALSNPSQWQVTPETARLLKHWRNSEGRSIRQFFCQVEAVETAIWLTEVAPHSRNGQRVLAHLAAANKDANGRIDASCPEA
jgi:type III restriction enzyme